MTLRSTNGRTVALTYHDVAQKEKRESVGFTGPLAARYKLDPEHFEAHLDALGGGALSVGLISRHHAPQVALTFDDGGASALTAAAALERRGWRGHFFITTARIGTSGFLSAAGVRELAERGHAVGSHSHTHPTYMGRLSRSDIEREWRESRAVLAEILEQPPPLASVPGGFLSADVVSTAAAVGFEGLLTSEPSSRVKTFGAMRLFGRYTIWATTAARDARAYAEGELSARMRLWLEWKAKHAAKFVSPPTYQRLRRLRARRQ
jgi:peptidoglycan/xylan/chitin deacetylase (PgdA/CDA1 family)